LAKNLAGLMLRVHFFQFWALLQLSASQRYSPALTDGGVGFNHRAGDDFSSCLRITAVQYAQIMGKQIEFHSSWIPLIINILAIR
jgi:hypothetical protein